MVISYELCYGKVKKPTGVAVTSFLSVPNNNSYQDAMNEKGDYGENLESTLIHFVSQF